MTEPARELPDTLSADYDAIMAGAAVRRMADRIVVRVTGDDRAEFLHGMTSADIKGMRPGSAAPALVLSEHARLIADFIVWARADALLLDIERRLWEKAHAQLERLLVADDVEMDQAADWSLAEIAGPRATEAVATAFKSAGAIAPWRWTETGAVMIGGVERIGTAGFTLLGPTEAVEGGLSALRQGFPAAREIDAQAAEIVRIEHGLARTGVDTSEKTIALEARLEPAISFSKGCYVGQETIERVTARGGVRKRLMGLRFEADFVPRPGALVLFNGKEVGRVGSTARSPRFGAIGLAILHQSAWSAGAGVTIDCGREGSRAAVVSELPFT